MSDVPRLLARFATLGDHARLRMLRLLARHELSVGELARAMQLPQSTVSRHLKVLHEGEWIVKRAEGTASLYRLLETELDRESHTLWRLATDHLAEGATIEEDDRRIAEILAKRRGDSRAFFGRLGGEWDTLRQDLFGGAFTKNAFLGFIDPAWTVADLGCGTGSAAELLSPFVAKIIAIDREPAMLDAARARLRSVDNIEFRTGDLEKLPLDDASIDAAMIFLVLHHVTDPAMAVAEAGRALRPGGVLIVVDMVAHDRVDYRHRMGHCHLGFSEVDVAEWLGDDRWQAPHYHCLRPDPEAKGPGLFVARLCRS